MAAALFYYQFLSTLPVRGATRPRGADVPGVAISIHAPREGSDGVTPEPDYQGQISIHAPREGSDVRRKRRCYEAVDISIHAPREGSDVMRQDARYIDTAFLSTLPVRGATEDGKHSND